MNGSEAGHDPDGRESFNQKPVCEVYCGECSTRLCARGMLAMLLGDQNVELCSTDVPPSTVDLVGKDYNTRTCECKIRDVACLTCGNVVGYHVTKACETCLDGCNNGHFWMFHPEQVKCNELLRGGESIRWGQLNGKSEPPLDLDGSEGVEQRSEECLR